MQVIDQPLTNKAAPNYHIDGFQTGALGDTSVGFRRLKWMKNVIIGNPNGTYLHGMLLSVAAVGGGPATAWPSHAVGECEIIVGYIEVSKPIGLKLVGADDVLVERCVCRSIINPYSNNSGSFHIESPARDVVIRDVAFPIAGPFYVAGAMTTPQLRAAVAISGWTDTRANPSAWPSWWPPVPPGRDRRLAHKPGPDAYRF